MTLQGKTRSSMDCRIPIANPHGSFCASVVGTWIIHRPESLPADLMIRRLNLPAEKVAVVYNGISLEGYEIRNPKSEIRNSTRAVARLSRADVRDKGLDTLVEAFILLKQRGAIPPQAAHRRQLRTGR